MDRGWDMGLCGSVLTFETSCSVYSSVSRTIVADVPVTTCTSTVAAPTPPLSDSWEPQYSKELI